MSATAFASSANYRPWVTGPPSGVCGANPGPAPEAEDGTSTPCCPPDPGTPPHVVSDVRPQQLSGESPLRLGVPGHGVVQNPAYADARAWVQSGSGSHRSNPPGGTPASPEAAATTPPVIAQGLSTAPTPSADVPSAPWRAPAR